MATDEPECNHLTAASLVTEWWEANLQFLLASDSAGFWFSTLAAGEGKSWRQLDTHSIRKNCSDE